MRGYGNEVKRMCFNKGIRKREGWKKGKWSDGDLKKKGMKIMKERRKEFRKIWRR